VLRLELEIYLHNWACKLLTLRAKLLSWTIHFLFLFVLLIQCSLYFSSTGEQFFLLYIYLISYSLCKFTLVISCRKTWFLMEWHCPLLRYKQHILASIKLSEHICTFFSNNAFEHQYKKYRKILWEKDPAASHHGSRLMTGFLLQPTAPPPLTASRHISLAIPKTKVPLCTIPRLPKLFDYVDYQQSICCD